jgi:PAS domain S-box-containing protein
VNSTGSPIELLTTVIKPADLLPGYAHIFKSIFERSAAGMVVLSLDGHCVWANQAFCELIGYSLEEVRSNNFRDITHPDDVAASQQLLQELIRREAKCCQIEKRYVHKSGRTVWVLLTATLVPRSADWQVDLSAGLVQDISKRKAAEEASCKSEALFRSIAENAGDLIRILDIPAGKPCTPAPRTRRSWAIQRTNFEIRICWIWCTPTTRPLYGRELRRWRGTEPTESS